MIPRLRGMFGRWGVIDRGCDCWPGWWHNVVNRFVYGLPLNLSSQVPAGFSYQKFASTTPTQER